MSDIMFLFMKIILLIIPLLADTAFIVSTPRKARLTLGEPSPSYYYSNINGYQGTYAFGYDVRDPVTGNVQFRNEERYPNGTVAGNYGYVDAFGRLQNYRYTADKRGYRVSSEYPKYQATPPVAQSPPIGLEPSITWSRPKKNKPVTNNNNYFTKLPINKGNVISSNNLLPPSHYAVD